MARGLYYGNVKESAISKKEEFPEEDLRQYFLRLEKTQISNPRSEFFKYCMHVLQLIDSGKISHERGAYWIVCAGSLPIFDDGDQLEEIALEAGQLEAPQPDTGDRWSHLRRIIDILGSEL